MSGIVNLSEVTRGIWRGGQPTDEGWNWLKESGITRIVKLNLEAEGSDTAATALGFQLIYTPIDLDDQLLFRPKLETVKSATDAIQLGTFIHCEHGQDRTGLIVGCWRIWNQKIMDKGE